MVAVELRQLTVDLGGTTPALDGVNLSIADGEAIVVAGPSGGGKTTLLRTIAGLQNPTSGDVLFDGQSVTSVSVRDRDISMISSEKTLYRHMNVGRNLHFPLEVRDVSAQQREQSVRATSRLLRLTHLLRRRTSTLSGGEAQRVALGRATSRKPRLFLLDEPLAHVEPAERERLTRDLRDAQMGMGVTTIFVTHDQRELMTLGERVAIISQGRIEQIAPALDLYNAPATTTVATFVGDPAMSLIRADLNMDTATVSLAGREWPLPPAMRVTLEGAPRTVLVGLRPQHVQIVPGPTSDTVPLHVNVVSSLGVTRQVVGDINDRPASRVTTVVPPASRIAGGDVVPVRLLLTRMHVFNAATGLALHPVPQM